jgi:hypothetical protein
VIFPAMLKAEGSYILPDNVPANEFLKETNYQHLKTGQFGCTNIWKNSQISKMFALRIDIKRTRNQG